MDNEAMWDAIRRSVEARNADPERMRRWLDDWEDRFQDDFHADNNNREDDYYV